MDDSRWARWSALGGALFVALILISGFLPGSPSKPSDSAAKIANFVNDNRDAIRWAGYIGALGVLALFWFLGAVWRFLREAEGGVPRLTVMAVAGAVFASATATIAGIMLSAMGILGVAGSGGPSGVRFFYVLQFNIGATTGIGGAVFVAAFSAVIIRSGALPRWMGWIGAVIALVMIVSAATIASTRDVFFNFSFGGFLAFSLWLLVVSIMMFMRMGQPAPVATSTA